MPKMGHEVYLTDIEVEILSVFVKRMILKDEAIINSLRVLLGKFEGRDA